MDINKIKADLNELEEKYNKFIAMADDIHEIINRTVIAIEVRRSELLQCFYTDEYQIINNINTTTITTYQKPLYVVNPFKP